MRHGRNIVSECCRKGAISAVQSISPCNEYDLSPGVVTRDVARGIVSVYKMRALLETPKLVARDFSEPVFATTNKQPSSVEWSGTRSV